MSFRVGTADGVSTLAYFSGPRRLLLDAANDLLYIVEPTLHRLRSLRISTGLYFMSMLLFVFCTFHLLFVFSFFLSTVCMT
jgi:hypothetical protein